jgi:hypothetical protein
MEGSSACRMGDGVLKEDARWVEGSFARGVGAAGVRERG